MDHLTACEFSSCGTFLSTADYGGRIVVFKRANLGLHGDIDTDDESNADVDGPTWSPFFQFQSHTTKLDYLRSAEISGRVTSLKAIPSGPQRLSLLTVNDNSIKLWKIGSRVKYSSAVKQYQSRKKLNLNKLIKGKRLAHTTEAKEIAEYGSSTHEYQIHSCDISSDNETMLSAGTSLSLFMCVCLCLLIFLTVVLIHVLIFRLSFCIFIFIFILNSLF